MRISVCGLGYVGAVCAACFANEGHRVIGVDIKKEKVDAINQGISPIVEPGLEEVIERSIKSGNLYAIQDLRKAIEDSELSFVAVGTPSRDNGALDLTSVKRVLAEIGEALRRTEEFHTVVIRSTILPGTMETVVIPTLEKISKKRAGKDFAAVFNPEFLREGFALNDFYNPPFVIIGENDKQGGVLERLWKSMPINVSIYRVKLKLAEMLKYTNNAFHGLKVVFANEIGSICKNLGVDSHKLMELFVQDTKLNISPHYLKPGFAFGGSCLPKDIKALTYLAKALDIEVSVLNHIIQSNELQIKRALQLILKTGRQKIGILGLSFKAETDDLRESPMVILTEYLLGKGKKIMIYDRNVNLSRLIGRNKEYIQEKLSHITDLLKKSLEEVVQNSEVLVIGTKNGEFKEICKNIQDKIIIDLVRIIEPKETINKYIGVSW